VPASKLCAEREGSTFGNSQDLRVLIPIQVARSLFTAPRINYTMSVMVSKKEILDQAIDNAMVLCVECGN
jgi:putative ABC transport system permease protein